MREDLLGNRNVVPIGSREWREWQRAGQEPDWPSLLPGATKPERACKPTTPDPVPQHLREAGRRGGLQRSRNYALRDLRKGVRFWRRYGSNAKDVTAAPVKAGPEVHRLLRTYASRGGRARADKYPPEMRRAWAALGGHAKAAKRRQLSLPDTGCSRQAGWSEP